ncbi:lysophospholipase-like protein 1 [Diadema antillarum]|uniref:lysophospholipase-like protein 1 n=1 Tax=Diadema antillarum TaxID=105358 RepID=UPI003A8B9649
MSLTRLKFDIIPASCSHASSVIFLHGSGDTADGLQDWLSSILGRRFSFSKARTIFPTAPLRPYTPMMGAPSNVWFDRRKIAPNVPEDLETINPMCEEIGKLIQQEVDQGVPKNKIILGGFSMGGCLALHVAYRFQRELAGVFALSSFLNDTSIVYKDLAGASAEAKPPLFACHGERDELVLHQWGVSTTTKLQEGGVDVEFHSYPRLCHEMNREELEKLQAWIEDRLSSL